VSGPYREPGQARPERTVDELAEAAAQVRRAGGNALLVTPTEWNEMAKDWTLRTFAVLGEGQPASW
jgi:hypothetical protein